MLLSLLGALSDYVVKFATYHPHYKKKLGIIESTNKQVTNSATFAFSCNRGGCADLSVLVTKKEELPKTFLHLFFHVF